MSTTRISCRFNASRAAVRIAVYIPAVLGQWNKTANMYGLL
jgi:hypothetical protein